MTTKHTPTPYSRTAFGVWSGAVMVADCRHDNGKSVYRPRSEDESVANAEFIVTACNTHADLVNALELAADDFAFILEEIDGDRDMIAGLESRLASIKKALAKVKGQES